MPNGFSHKVRTPPTMEGTDYELIALHIAGDKRALEEIVRRYTPRLRPHLERVLWQLESDDRRATIEDVLQEVWLRVVRYAIRLNPQHKFSTWIFTVATRLALNEHRNRRRRAGRIPMLVDPETGVPEEMDIVDNHSQSRPDVVCEGRDTLEKLAQYLKQHCGRINLVVLELREVHGYSYAEIAQRVGVPVGTVKSRLGRARQVARRFRDANK